MDTEDYLAIGLAAGVGVLLVNAAAGWLARSNPNLGQAVSRLIRTPTTPVLYT